jgi:hypothetical protein
MAILPCGNLTASYAALSSQLAVAGFDGAAIEAARSAFNMTPRGPQPRFYAAPPWRLPPGSVRVLALPLADPVLSPTGELVRLVVHTARIVETALPDGWLAWRAPTSTLHATLFHPGISPGLIGRRAPGEAKPTAPTADELSRELVAVGALAAQVGGSEGMELVAERVVMTPGGVLLLLLSPGSGCSADGAYNAVERLRDAAGAAFPRAGSKQVRKLIHVSLLRLVRIPPGLPAHQLRVVADRIAALCQVCTDRLRGARVTLRGLVYSVEAQIMTLEGEKHAIPFGPPRSGQHPVLRGRDWAAAEAARRAQRRSLITHAPQRAQGVGRQPAAPG